jgi:hypothetical protein
VLKPLNSASLGLTVILERCRQKVFNFSCPFFVKDPAYICVKIVLACLKLAVFGEMIKKNSWQNVEWQCH